ncbi:MAG: hypothetical protein LBQ54_06265 [Planctomycetaceae bacterium]|nr:hypothetical protein [Planctomycetaceae bacterium]
MPPAGSVRTLHPCWSCRSESHGLAPVGRWSQPAEQRYHRNYSLSPKAYPRRPNGGVVPPVDTSDHRERVIVSGR